MVGIEISAYTERYLTLQATYLLLSVVINKTLLGMQIASSPFLPSCTNLTFACLPLVPPVLVVSQTASTAVEPCQSLLGVTNDNPQCSSLGNCTGLRCDQRGGVLDGSSATFVVTKCVDPVAVDLSVESSGGAVDQRTFTQNGSALYTAGSVNVSVGMWRNASHLLFQVSLWILMKWV